LRPAGGVDGEIHRGAGARLKEELSRIDGCSVGDVIVTHAYDLKARYIIHAVGPRFGAEVCRESELLLSCYRRVFEECVLLGAVSVCFPTISTGINSFPASDAARVAIRATREFLAHTGFAITITFCCNSQLDHDSYQEALVEKPWIQS
jgi:O-acetyl-ADP-ribose deacetylase (regulator of RNase III)